MTAVLSPLTDQSVASVRRVQALVNPAAGRVGPGAARELASLFAEFGLDHKVSELMAGRFQNTARAAVDAGPDLIVVLGGDGTARRVAEMCGPRGPLLAPLPGGTMSKLSRAIYGARPWREALAGALERGAARRIPGGEVGGRAFFCTAVLGSPALWARAREAIRAHQLGRAWRGALIALRGARPSQLRYEFDGASGRGLVIGLICPTISRALGEDEGALELAVLDRNDTRTAARLALNNLVGDWRDDPGVTVRPCVGGRVWARDGIPAMLDGEFCRLGRQAAARFRPCAFRALAPSADAIGK